eukprot:gene11284-21476_t
MGDGNKSRSRGRKRKRRVRANQFLGHKSPNKESGTPAESFTQDNVDTSTSHKKIYSGSMLEQPSTTNEPVKEGFILIDLSILCQFFELNVPCQECKQHALSCRLAVEKKSGFSHILQLNCEACEFQSTLETSKKVEGTGSGRASNEVNLRMVSFARSIGRGYSVLENFSACLNSPQPMTKKNYKKAFSKVLAANKEVAKESMKAAAIEIKANGVSKCAVSLDGSWQRRGHSSHHGIVSCISVETGKCIDIEVLSNFCEGCAYWEDGPDSWCGYKRDPDSFKHKTGLPMPIYNLIKPIFDDLASPNLLKKCLHGKTQNNNECLNKLVWDRCSKEYFVEKDVIQDASYSAVTHFNDGKKSVLRMFLKMNITPGKFTEQICRTLDSRRLVKAGEKTSAKLKSRRKLLRAKRKGFADKKMIEEGNLYEPGGH